LQGGIFTIAPEPRCGGGARLGEAKTSPSARLPWVGVASAGLRRLRLIAVAWPRHLILGERGRKWPPALWMGTDLVPIPRPPGLVYWGVKRAQNHARAPGQGKGGAKQLVILMTRAGTSHLGIRPASQEVSGPAPLAVHSKLEQRAESGETRYCREGSWKGRDGPGREQKKRMRQKPAHSGVRARASSELAGASSGSSFGAQTVRDGSKVKK
jgi:hypothetical protein